jgi:hypothetical protein
MLSAILNNDDHNEVTDALVLSHTTTTAAEAGVGVGVSVHVENAAGTVAERAAMDFTLTDVTDGAEIGQFELKLAKGDGTVPTVLTVNGVQATVAMDTDSRYVLFSVAGGAVTVLQWCSHGVAVTVLQSRWCSHGGAVLQSRCCIHSVAVTVLQSRCCSHGVASTVLQSLQSQCYIHSVTSTVLHPQCYIHSDTSTVLHPQCYIHSVAPQ